jgi:endonuclease/exonuclease/phosphatase family metal-dependent hydrolase
MVGSRVDQLLEDLAVSAGMRGRKDSTFELIATVLTSGASRRRLLGGLIGGTLTGALGWQGTEAEKKRRDNHRNKRSEKRKKHRKTRKVEKQSKSQGSSAALKVLTRNLYLGADLTPLFGAPPQQFFQTVAQVFAAVQATNFPERAQALADEIAAIDPHIVGLQEVTLWRSQTPSDFFSLPNDQPNADVIEYDFQALLLDALAARGKHYEAVATVQNDDAEAPGGPAGGPLRDIRITDRDVILARTDLPDHVFSVSNAQGDNFEAQLVINTPALGPIIVRRGWVSVEVSLHGRSLRVVNTHLERSAPEVQEDQADELIVGPLATALPTVLLGDLNSAADGIGAVPGESNTQTYKKLLAVGFADAAVKVGKKPDKKVGFTCCQDGDLANASSQLSERIDFVLTRGEIRASSANRVGDDPGDRTPSGLWPSDHAGVWAVLHL